MDEALKACLREFGVEDEEDQEECIELIKQQDESFEMRVGKKKRKEFGERVRQIVSEFSREKKSEEEVSIGKQTLEEKIKEVLEEFGIEEAEDQEEVMELIRKKDASYELRVKKKLREEFRKRVEELLAEGTEEKRSFEEEVRECLMEFGVSD